MSGLSSLTVLQSYKDIVCAPHPPNMMAGADLPQWCVSDQLRPSAGLGRSPAFLPRKPVKEASGHRPSGRPQQLRQPEAPPRSWRKDEAKETFTPTARFVGFTHHLQKCFLHITQRIGGAFK